MWPFSKQLEDVLGKSHKIKVHGIFFYIRKIDPSNFIEGSKVMLQEYSTYKLASEKTANYTPDINKIKEHYIDVFLSSIVYPKLSRKSDGSGIFVNNLFTEWDLAHELYSKIIEYTYGKKKLKLDLSQKTV